MPNNIAQKCFVENKQQPGTSSTYTNKKRGDENI